MRIVTSDIPDGSMSSSSENLKQAKINLAKFISKNSLIDANVASMGQVHGINIQNVMLGGRYEETDGLLTTNKSLALAVYHADCIPLFLHSREPYILGAAHVGWKGLQAQLPEKMVGEMVKLGANPKQIQIKTGPFICAKHYDVAKDDARIGYFPIVDFNKYIGLDLKTELENQLLETGVVKNNIEYSGCTTCQPEKYSSYHANKKAILRVSIAIA